MTWKKMAIVTGVVAACGGDSGTGPGTGRTVAVTVTAPSDVVNALGAEIRFVATALDDEGNDLSGRDVSWSVSDTSVLSITDEGTATARAVGVATVTATIDGVSGGTSVEVRQILANVRINPAPVTLVGRNQTAGLAATGRDSLDNAMSGLTFTWAISDEAVATVDSVGTITSVDYGTATVTASAGGIDGTASLTVVPGLDYAAWYGGGPAGNWDLTNFNSYAATVPDLVTTYDSRNIYNKPVNPEMNAAVASADPPDVISGPIGGGLRDLVVAGLIEDITDLWLEQNWDNRFPAAIREMSSVDGRRYFVPQAMQWNTIFYNEQVFTDLGLSAPGNWAELLQLCTEIAAAGVIPFTVSAQWSPPVARWFTLINLRLNGAAFHESLMRGEVPYTDQRVRGVFEHWVELFDAGCFAPGSGSNSYGTAVNEVASGVAAMWNIGEWLYESVSGATEDNLDFFDFPVIDPTVESGEIVHVYGAFMVAGADHPEQARDFLAYLGNADSQLSNALALSRVVANLDVPVTTYNDVRQRGLQLIVDADHATPLFEVATDPAMSQVGLNTFVQFWNDPAPARIDSYLAQLEAQRAQSYD